MANIEDLRIDLPLPKPRHRRRSSWAGLGLLAAAIAVVLLLFGDRITGAVSGGVAKTRQVDVFTVGDTNDAATGGFSAGGYLEAIPPGPVIVSALIGGRVASLEAIPGQVVAGGDVIARLDASVLEQSARVQAAQVEITRRRLALIEAGFRREEIEEAEADLKGHRAELEQIEAEYRRSTELLAEGVTSELAHEKVRARYEQALAEQTAAEVRLAKMRSGSRQEDIALARAEFQAAEAALEELQWKIDQCIVRAPVDGVVYAQFTQPGSWVEPGTDDRHSSALVSIFDPTQIQAWVDVNQRDSAALFVGQQAWLTTDAYPRRGVAARVIRVMPAANLQKNTVQAKLAIPDPPPDFRPELSVKIAFLPHDPAEPSGEVEGIPIPATAMVLRHDQTGVFVYANGIVHWRTVEISGGDEAFVRAAGGIKPGDQVVIHPDGLKDGQAVALISGQDQTL